MLSVSCVYTMARSNVIFEDFHFWHLTRILQCMCSKCRFKLIVFVDIGKYLRLTTTKWKFFSHLFFFSFSFQIIERICLHCDWCDCIACYALVIHFLSLAHSIALLIACFTLSFKSKFKCAQMKDEWEFKLE